MELLKTDAKDVANFVFTKIDVRQYGLIKAMLLHMQ